MTHTIPGLPPHQARLLETAVGTGYGLWAGVKLLSLIPGQARVAFDPRREMLTPWATLNGGVISSLVEIPAFLALLPSLREGELPVTNDIFVQHLRQLPGDRTYELTGTLLRRGKTMAWCDVVVHVDGKDVSLARITKTILVSAAGP